MSTCLEFEGKAVENAVENASEALNIPKEKLRYTVVSRGATGIFGLVGVKKAKICVTLPDDLKTEDITPKKEQRRKNEEKPLKRNHLDEQTAKSVSSLIKEAFNEGPPEKKERPAEKEKPEKEMEDGPLVMTEALELGQEVLQRIIDFITTDAKLSVKKGEDRVLFNVEGGNTGVLIGKRGQTLEAIQYLVEKVVNRHSDERVRIQVDVEGYLNKRRDNLESLARRLAEKAKHTGKPSTIAQMNAHDRRIIHLALKDDGGVRTQSVGDGFYRKLVIFPRRRRNPGTRKRSY